MLLIQILLKIQISVGFRSVLISTEIDNISQTLKTARFCKYSFNDYLECGEILS